MKDFKSTFTNELGNRIEISLMEDERGITISATGPTSEVEHTWTRNEAMEIRGLLNYLVECGDEDVTLHMEL